MFELFLAEFRRSWILFRRYFLESLGKIFISTCFFYALFLSASYIGGASFQLGDRLDSIVIGYVLVNLITFVLANIAGRLQYEASTGTLEQLFLSRYGAVKVFLMRAIADLIIELITIISILLIVILLTGSRLNYPLELFLPFIALVLGTYGFAFIMGAISLLFKQVQQILSIVQFSLLFLLITPPETWTGNAKILVQLFPMTSGADLLRDLMARGDSLNLTKLAIAFVNGSVYFCLGLFLFQLAEREAKRRGILTGY